MFVWMINKSIKRSEFIDDIQNQAEKKIFELELLRKIDNLAIVCVGNLKK